jgi:hypothetical protein
MALGSDHVTDRLNDAQVVMLRWIAGGHDDGEATNCQRVTARALSTRRLVKIKGRCPRWRAELTAAGHAAESASGDTLLLMLGTLRQNQERHARRDGTIANVARDETEAAVSLAVTLVHWFTSGLVTKSDT